MRARWLPAVVMGLALGGARCAAPLVPAGAPRTVAGNVPDLAEKNLPPDQEIAALLAGLPGLGTPSAPAARVAVVPLAVPGAAALAWVGEAASEVVGERLAVVPGVSVLRRVELGKIADAVMRAAVAGDDALVARLGRSIQATQVVYGRATPDGEARFNLSVRVVTVATDAGREVASGALARGDIAGTAGQAAASVAAAFGGVGGEPLGLSSAALEAAARAETLSGDGKALEAIPLYAEALASPSRAFRLETELARLLMDVGLEAESSKRAREALGRAPPSAETACVRAGLMLEMVREKWDVAETRDAVRTAASCGDPALTAPALQHHAYAMSDRHHPTETAALERAHALTLAAPLSWYACWVDFHRYNARADSGNWEGRRDTHLVEIARACEAAGNLRLASLALATAADESPEARRRIELFEEAEGAVRPEAGAFADSAAIRLAGELRKTGRAARADEKLLAALGARLRAVVALHGGLPAPLDRLDPALLQAAGVGAARPTAAAPKDALVGQALRVSVGNLLRHWAERTRADSPRKAEAYLAVANELDPPTQPAPAGETLDAWLDRQLDEVKLPLARIAALDAPPPWASGANEDKAFRALLGWLRSARRRDDERSRQVLTAAAKVAGWVEQPDLTRLLSLEKCRRLDARGRHAEAAAEARASLKDAPDDPGWTARALACAGDALTTTDAKAMLEVSALRVAAAKQVSGSAWVEALYWTAYDAFDTRQGTAEHVAALERAAAELEGAEDHAAAAQALSYAGQIANMADHYNGAVKAIALARARVAILDRLDDRARSLEARVDVLAAVRQRYASGWPKDAREYVAAAPEVVEAMPEIRGRAETLAASGRPLDAARQVARIPLGAPGLAELAALARGWVNDGDDHPAVLAALQVQRGLLETSPEARRDAFAKARDLYAGVGDKPSAVDAGQRLIAAASVEADLWSANDGCLAVAKPSPREAQRCYITTMQVLHDIGPERLRDLGRVRALYAAAEASRREYTFDNAGFRFEYRSKLAETAALAGDFREADRIEAEIEADSRGNGFPYAQHLARLAVLTAARDPKRALAACRRFDATGAASPVWLAGQYAKFADIARRAGDDKALADYERRGREAARRADVEALPYYELNLAKQAIRKKDWRAAAKGYLLAAETQKKDVPTDNYGPAEHASSAAQALLYARDTKAADALLDPLVRHVERQLKEGKTLERPCFDAGVLALSAASRRAAGQCAEGDRLRALSAQVRARCQTEVCYPTSREGTWCDRPGWLTGRLFDNACHAPVPVDGSTLPHAP